MVDKLGLLLVVIGLFWGKKSRKRDLIWPKSNGLSIKAVQLRWRTLSIWRFADLPKTAFGLPEEDEETLGLLSRTGWGWEIKRNQLKIIFFLFFCKYIIDLYTRQFLAWRTARKNEHKCYLPGIEQFQTIWRREKRVRWPLRFKELRSSLWSTLLPGDSEMKY